MKPFLVATCLSLSQAAPQALACDTALLLAIDVSNSIDSAEYRLQTDGLADAVLDPEVLQALVDGQVALSVVQWSGEGHQQLSIPWTQIHAPDDVLDFSARARSMPRAFVLSNTAIGDAILFAIDQFGDAPVCLTQVIDISGDGTPNAGSDTRLARREAERRGITIRACCN